MDGVTASLESGYASMVDHIRIPGHDASAWGDSVNNSIAGPSGSISSAGPSVGSPSSSSGLPVT
ncbi:hypothetical protein C455_02018 [Haloferax larsenii JCM 13917]|nr:hypothetical protein C455_02018 [Haloferax larsenii JCM 13917]